MAFPKVSGRMLFCFNAVFVFLCIVLMQCGGLSAFEHGTPSQTREKLENAALKTICPFTVEMNRNVTRWPQVIKIVSCLRHTVHRCCNHEYACTQLTDDVVLYSLDRSSNWTEPLDVGCVCMKTKEGSNATSAPRPSEG